MELVQLVTFELADEMYGIDVFKVNSVARYQKINHMPDSANIIEGVIDLRGDVIPVVDLHKRFHLEPPATYKKTRIIITESKGYLFGFIVGKVHDVCSFSLSEFRSVPPGVNHSSAEFMVGITHKDQHLLTYLDIDQVLDIEQLLGHQTAHG
ncbi:MAG: purine-binding chemotaxis protein CheW [SAR324 cluster bacterium]|nr:purine-binding chemotaxis protein CheW [SAR324 cluster bacterium]